MAAGSSAGGAATFATSLKFSPPLIEGNDYKIRVVDRNDMEINLLDNKAWRSDAGALLVTAINTRGDDVSSKQFFHLLC